MLSVLTEEDNLSLFVGANFFPKRIPGRIAFLQILLFNWIMYNYYSGSIVSARLSEPLDMMEDDVTVLADSDLKIAAEAVPYLNYFLYVRMTLDRHWTLCALKSACINVRLGVFRNSARNQLTSERSVGILCRSRNGICRWKKA